MRNRLSRKKKTVIFFIFILTFAWIYWQNHSIQVTKYQLSGQEIPEQFDGFLILQISDFHNAYFGKGQRRLLEKIKNIDADMIVVTGDLIDANHPDVGRAMELVLGMVQKAPVYYVTGNHEAWNKAAYRMLKKQMSGAGVHILDHESCRIACDGAHIRLLGLRDIAFDEAGNLSYEREAAVDSTLQRMGAGGAEYEVLLSHRPELLSVYADNGVEVVLSGHAHGGQVRIPFFGGLIAPDQGFFPEYTAGIYRKAKTRMVVSRGLGNSVLPLRINNRPELVVVRLEKNIG